MPALLQRQRYFFSKASMTAKRFRYTITPARQQKGRLFCTNYSFFNCRSWLLAAGLLLQTWPLLAWQEVPQPQGQFGKDRVQLGETVDYLLVFRHSPETEFRFPDEKYDFGPFEYLDHQFYTTSTSQGISIDSIRYTLATYELNPVQTLAVPVLLQNGSGQEQAVYPLPDTVLLQEVLGPLPDSLQVFENTTPVIVTREFNYYYLAGAVLLLLLLGVGGTLLFGNRIKKYFLIRKLQRQHQAFMQEFSAARPEQDYNTGHLAKAVGIWKGYTGNLLQEPVASLTTRELRQKFGEGDISRALQQLDQAIYAGIFNDDLGESLECLQKHAAEFFNRKLEKVKNG